MQSGVGITETIRVKPKEMDPVQISDSEGIGALEEIETIIFGRDRREARTIGRIYLREKTKHPPSCEEDQPACAQHRAIEVSESEREIIRKKFVILLRYFEQRSEFLSAGWRVEKQAMRIKMALLIVRTKVLGEGFLPG